MYVLPRSLQLADIPVRAILSQIPRSPPFHSKTAYRTRFLTPHKLPSSSFWNVDLTVVPYCLDYYFQARDYDVLMRLRCLFKEATMSCILLCENCAQMGGYVCFSVFHRNIVDQSIESEHHPDITLHGNSPPNNLTRKECCYHFVQLTRGHLGGVLCILFNFSTHLPCFFGCQC
jgi:hypothetical protein